MSRNHSNNRGVSMLVVLGALIITGFLGIALMKLATGGQLSNVFFASSASARSAAQSGIIAAVSWLENPSNAPAVLTLANNWRKGTTSDIDKRITPATPDNNGYISLGSSADSHQKYKVEIIGFDIPKRTISLRCEGLGKGKSRATITAVYKIEGLINSKGAVPTNALHMGGGGSEFNRAMRVYGGTYLNGQGKFQDQLFGVSEFYGPVHIGHRTGDVCQIKSCDFKDRALFEGDIELSQFDAGSSFIGQVDASGNPVLNNYNQQVMIPTKKRVSPVTHFRKAVGIGGEFNVIGHLPPQEYPLNYMPAQADFITPFSVESEQLLITGTLKLQSDNQISMNQGGTNGIVRYSSTATGYLGYSKDPTPKPMVDLFTNASTSSSGISNLRTELGFGTPPQIDFDRSALSTVEKNVTDVMAAMGWGGYAGNGDSWCDIDGAKMNYLYDHYPFTKFKDESGDEWMVMNYNLCYGGKPFQKGGTEGFRGRVIWILDSQSAQINEEFYEHSDQGLTVFYVAGTGKLVNIGGCQQFRGLIYSETSEENSYRALNGTKFVGAIYQKDGAGTMRIDGPVTGTPGFFDVYWDSDVMEEIRSLGILFDPGAASAEVLSLKPGVGISATLVSQSM